LKINNACCMVRENLSLTEMEVFLISGYHKTSTLK